MKSKHSVVFFMALAGLFGSFALLAGPAGAEVSGGAHADDSSVASGNATALRDSTASGDSIAVDGSTASGCSVATDWSTASGADPCPSRAVAPVARGQVAVPTGARSLALTGSSNADLAAAAAMSLIVGGLLVALTSDRRRVLS